MKKQVLPLVALLALALVLAACAGASWAAEPPASAEEVLERARAAMAEVQSFRFTGEITSEDVRETRQSVTINRVKGEWAAPDRYVVREESRREPDTFEYSVEWLASDGIVVHRHPSGTNEWREFMPPFATRPPNAPLHTIPTEYLRVEWHEDATVDGIAVYHVSMQREVTGLEREAPPIFTSGYYISKDDFRVLRYTYGVNHAEGRTEPHAAEREARLGDYRLFDFNAAVSIELPDEWVPLVYTKFEFAITGDPKPSESREVVVERLLSLRKAGGTATSAGVSEGALRLWLFENHLSVEQVTRVVTTPGHAELVERVCLASPCEEPAEYEDRPTGITSAHFRAFPAFLEPTRESPIIGHMHEEHGGLLADLKVRLRASEAAGQEGRLLLVMDGEVVAAAEIEERQHGSVLVLTGDFASGEEVEELAAILHGGPLPAPLTLVSVEEGP